MKICRNCRWYDTEYNTDGTCDRIDWFDPHDPRDAPPESDTDAYLSVAADDDQGLQVELRVGPNFGCVRFEEKS